MTFENGAYDEKSDHIATASQNLADSKGIRKRNLKLLPTVLPVEFWYFW